MIMHTSIILIAIGAFMLNQGASCNDRRLIL